MKLLLKASRHSLLQVRRVITLTKIIISYYLPSPCTVPPPTVSVAPADNDLKYVASSLTLICTISLDRMLVDIIGITVDSAWTGPHGKLFLDGSHNGRIIVTPATKGADGSYRSTVVITPLHMSDTGSYSCEAGVSHMLEFVSASNLKSSDIMINVKGNRMLL